MVVVESAILLYPDAIGVTRAGFGSGSGPIYLSNIDCGGTESALVDCQLRRFGGSNFFCDHTEDAGVVCLREHIDHCMS